MNILSSFEKKEMHESEEHQSEELRLFVYMIWKLNAKASITAEGEGAGHDSSPKERLRRNVSDSNEPSKFVPKGELVVSSSVIAEISQIVNEYGSLVH